MQEKKSGESSVLLLNSRKKTKESKLKSAVTIRLIATIRTMNRLYSRRNETP